MQADRILMVGLNHLSAPVSCREKAAIEAAELPKALRELSAVAGLEEVVALSTCSRVEVYASSSDPEDSQGRLSEWFLRRAGEAAIPALRALRGRDALWHLFRVASGLDSWIVGESEVLGQVKQAYQGALAAGKTGPTLNRVFQRAISAGKSVRAVTGIQNGIRSIGGAAALLAKKIFGPEKDCRILVFGAGEAAGAVVKHLAAKNFNWIIVANRGLDRARAVAEPWGGRAVPLEEGLRLLSEVEIAVFSVSSKEPMLQTAVLAPKLHSRKRPLFMIDLGMPRNVDPGCRALEGVYLYDLEDLKGLVRDSMEKKAPEKEKAEELAASAAEQCCAELDKPRPAPLCGVARPAMREGTPA